VYVNINSYYTIQNQGYSRTDYTFNGWNTRADGTGISYADNQIIYVTAPITLYAMWKPDKQQVDVTYNPNGGVGAINVVSVNTNSNYSIQNQGYTRTDHTFNGWNTRADGTGTGYADNQIIYVTAPVTLYAMWKPDIQQVDVTYNPNGGVGSINVVNVNINTNYTILDQNYTRVNHSFIGWNTRADGTGTNYSNSSNIYVSTSITLYAQWSEDVQQVKVIYDPNGGVGLVNEVYVNVNSNYTIQNQGYTMAGNNFTGWNTRADGTGTGYSDNQTIYVTAQITLYAQWDSNIQQVAITYLPNGGIRGTIVEYANLNSSYEILSPDVDYSRPYHTFVRWDIQANGEGKAYYIDEVVSITAPITLYAIWYPDFNHAKLEND
jgi:uncharacterized repeat protein (TIGR02543 family)